MRRVISILLFIFVLCLFNACQSSYDKQIEDLEHVKHSLEDEQRALSQSCHSTEEHIRALYTFDFDQNNYIDEDELDLFLSAHPRVYNDTGFNEWVESGHLK